MGSGEVNKEPKRKMLQGENGNKIHVCHRNQLYLFPKRQSNQLGLILLRGSVRIKGKVYVGFGKRKVIGDI